jgi:hypothetical protein
MKLELPRMISAFLMPLIVSHSRMSVRDEQIVTSSQFMGTLASAGCRAFSVRETKCWDACGQLVHKIHVVATSDMLDIVDESEQELSRMECANARKGGMNELYNKRSYARVRLDTTLELFRVWDPVLSKRRVGNFQPYPWQCRVFSGSRLRFFGR